MSKQIKEIIVRYDDKQSFIYGNGLGEVVGELVRCKECKHWDRAIDESGTIERFNFSRCIKGHYGDGLGFYCADGEVRDE